MILCRSVFKSFGHGNFFYASFDQKERSAGAVEGHQQKAVTLRAAFIERDLGFG